MEGVPNNIEKSEREIELKELAGRISDLYIQAAETHLPEGDPLRDRILDYYLNRSETENELLVFLENRSEEVISNYIENLEHLNRDGDRFIEQMEKIYELQDVHTRRRESQNSSRLASDEEYELGAYVDVLETQVKDAVLVLQKKGYKTFQSGFREKNPRDQFMDFYNKKIDFPKDLALYLKHKGIDLEIDHYHDRTTLYLHPKRHQAIRLSKWKEIWDHIADSLPQADGEMLEGLRVSGEHQDFRRKQDALRGRVE